MWAEALIEGTFFIHDLKVVVNNYYKLTKIIF